MSAARRKMLLVVLVLLVAGVIVLVSCAAPTRIPLGEDARDKGEVAVEPGEASADTPVPQAEERASAGVLDPSDFESEEEYSLALIESGAPQVEVPKEKIEYDDGSGGYIKGMVVLYADFESGEQPVRSLVESLGGVWVSDTFSWPDSEQSGRAIVDVYFPGAETEDDLLALVQEMESDPAVRSAAPSYWSNGITLDEGDSARSLQGYAVNDPGFQLQIWLRNSAFSYAWEKVRCRSRVEIALLDSGIDLDHPDLLANIGTTMPYDAYDETILQGDEQDAGGHGTEVAGVACAVANNGVGIAGASFNARIIPVRITDSEGTPTPDALVRALSYVFSLSEKPEVINMSFSGPEKAWGSRFHEIEGMISRASEEFGIVCVATSGNTANSEIRYPGAFAEVLCVGAVQNNGDHSPSSTSNDYVSLVATGQDVYTTLNPDFSGGAYYGGASGTSFSAPQVSAVAALLSAQNAKMTASQIRKRIESTAKKLDGMNGLNWTSQYGFGLLDAASAVGWLPSSPSTGVDDLAAEGVASQAARQRVLQSIPPERVQTALERARAANPEAVAWLYVPGTGVSLPVCRHEGDDSYYLDHDSRRAESPLGAVYMEEADSAALDQPLTVLYGHSFSDAELMFTGLHAFEDGAFFRSHEYVYVFAEGGWSAYRVVEAACYTGAHIAGIAGEGDEASLQVYFDAFADTDPEAFVGFRRPCAIDAGADRVLQLSTCTVPAAEDARFVVSAVLVE